MTEVPEAWRLHVEAAQLAVERAQQGEFSAARDVISQCVIALRGVLADERPDAVRLPDPHQLVYLRSLLNSLEDVDKGKHPAAALHLEKPGHRVANPGIGVRDALLFILVGEAFDALVARGNTRADKPIETALHSVAKKTNLKFDTVQKAWTNGGAATGWAVKKADWN